MRSFFVCLVRSVGLIDASPWGSTVVCAEVVGVQYPTLPLSAFLGEPICPIVGSKEALCRANEIKAHLGEGINQSDRFNGARVELGWGVWAVCMNRSLKKIITDSARFFFNS